MATETEELVGFLSSPSLQVKKAALDIVRGLTGSEDGIKSLANHSELLVSSLLPLINDTKEFEKPALEAVVNLSQDTDIATKMIEVGAVEKVLNKLGKGTPLTNQLLCMLLVNLTQQDEAVKRLFLTKDGKEQNVYLAKLVRLFTTSSRGAADSVEECNDDPYEHIASILVNISRMECGRRVILDSKLGLLKQIIRQSDSANPLRKRGVLGTVRNCCFESETQIQNFLMISEYLWPALLLPLAGKQAYTAEDTRMMPLELATPLSHEREPEKDPEIRVQAAESLYLIIMQEEGRKAFWSLNGPKIIELGYAEEEDAQVMEAYERIGSLNGSLSILEQEHKDTATSKALGSPLADILVSPRGNINISRLGVQDCWNFEKFLREVDVDLYNEFVRQGYQLLIFGGTSYCTELIVEFYENMFYLVLPDWQPQYFVTTVNGVLFKVDADIISRATGLPNKGIVVKQRLGNLVEKEELDKFVGSPYEERRNPIVEFEVQKRRRNILRTILAKTIFRSDVVEAIIDEEIVWINRRMKGETINVAKAYFKRLY